MDTKIFLEIGGQPKPQAHYYFGEDAKILHLNALEKYKPDILGDASNLSNLTDVKFDGIFASHVLEHFSYWNTESVIKEWVSCLKPEGHLYIVVPSLEWAAREILAEHPSPAVLPHLFAGHMDLQYDAHFSGFTMRSLRGIFSRAGLVLRGAKTHPYTITVAGKEYSADEHHIWGVKNVD